MNTDFRISVTLTRHPKTRRLLRRLGQGAFYNLICLWTFTAVYKPKGVFTDMTPEEIEDAAEWNGEPGEFVRTLVELRLLDEDEDGTLRTHDWRDHNGYASSAQDRSDKARKSSRARWDRNEHDAQTGNEHDAQTGNEHDAPSPSPSPSPSPTPNVEDVGAERLPAGNPSTPAEPPPEPFGIGVPLVDGTEYAVTRTDVEQWQAAFPGVDVPQELREIRAWADANPTRRKTRGGVRRHICAWLSREQDKGGSSSRASPSGAPANPRSLPNPVVTQRDYMRELGNALNAIEEAKHDHHPSLEPAERAADAPCRALPDLRP